MITFGIDEKVDFIVASSPIGADGGGVISSTAGDGTVSFTAPVSSGGTPVTSGGGAGPVVGTMGGGVPVVGSTGGSTPVTGSGTPITTTYGGGATGGIDAKIGIKPVVPYAPTLAEKAERFYAEYKMPIVTIAILAAAYFFFFRKK